MPRALVAALTVTALVAVTAGRLFAQSPKVGDMAPDFTLKGSTKDGPLAKPIHLAELRGQVVVLAFFPKARTKG
jgi:thioredoxin-dependent peroxiredoxin